MKNGECATCDLWKPYRDTSGDLMPTGVCQLRLPPFIATVRRYPTTEATDWCSFHRPGEGGGRVTTP